MTDLQQMLIMLAKTDEPYERVRTKMHSGSISEKITITGRNVEINFKDDGSLHYFYSQPLKQTI